MPLLQTLPSFLPEQPAICNSRVSRACRWHSARCPLPGSKPPPWQRGEQTSACTLKILDSDKGHLFQGRRFPVPGDVTYQTELQSRHGKARANKLFQSLLKRAEPPAGKLAPRAEESRAGGFDLEGGRNRLQIPLTLARAACTGPRPGQLRRAAVRRFPLAFPGKHLLSAVSSRRAASPAPGPSR